MPQIQFRQTVGQGHKEAVADSEVAGIAELLGTKPVGGREIPIPAQLVNDRRRDNEKLSDVVVTIAKEEVAIALVDAGALASDRSSLP